MNTKISVSLMRIALALAVGLAVGMGPARIARAAFPGMNGKIAFHSNRDGNYEIYTMNSDGSNPTRLTNNAASDLFPAWSPDGTQIAFQSDRDGNIEIYVMDADGSNPTRLTNNAADDNIPAWSPDGARIAFIRASGPRSGDVYVMNSDGSGETKLTNYVPGNFPNAFTVAWSPDGAKMALSVSLSDTHQEIYLMNADGSGLTALTSNGVLSSLPNWSPDGAKIAFNRNPAGSGAIYVMNSDGSSQTSLTNNGDAHAAWSPDGVKIAFVSGRDGNGEVYVMNADGTGQVNLTSNPAEDGHPDWQPQPQLVFSPTTANLGVGGNTTVLIDLNAIGNLYGYQFRVNYDATKVSATGAFVNSFFDTAGGSIPSGWNASCAAGVCQFAVTQLNPAPAVTGSGPLAQITFTGVAPGTVPLTFSSDVLSDRDGIAISHTTGTAALTVYGFATLSGTVNLQGRASPSDATGTVTLTDTGGVFAPTVATIAANGTWTATNVPVMPGGSTYQLDAAHSLYLGNQLAGVALTPGNTYPQPATALKGGDANNDGTISVGDLSCIGGDFGGAPGNCGGAGGSDINADGAVNILDLVLAGGNYGLSTPQSW